MGLATSSSAIIIGTNQYCYWHLGYQYRAGHYYHYRAGHGYQSSRAVITSATKSVERSLKSMTICYSCSRMLILWKFAQDFHLSVFKQVTNSDDGMKDFADNDFVDRTA